MSIQSLAGWGTALAAGKAALDVAKDAFFASEATVDEWGRVMDSSKSLYEGFLTSLNTGDISGYLNHIDSIVQAARAAYDELDRLGTMKTIQAPQMSAQQTENERMRMMIQTGRYIAPVDGRRASMQNGQLLTPEQIRRLETQLQNGMKSVVSLVGNEVKQTGKAIDAVYNRQAQELGMSLKEFRKGTSSMAEFDKRMAGYDQYQKWREKHTTIDMQSGREIVARGNPFEQFAKWGTFRVDGQRYNDLVRLIQQRDQQAAQAYSMQSQAYRTMNRAEGVTVSKLMKGGETSGGGRSAGSGGIKEEKDDFVEINGLINMATERVSDLQKRIREAPTENMITELREQLKDAQAELDRLNGKEVKFQTQTDPSIQNEAGMSAYIDSIKKQLETADYGTSLYNGLSAQLTDMTTLQNLVGESLKAGLGTVMFDVADETGMDFWTRAMEGGVEDIDWQTIVDKINEARKTAGLDAISLDFKTGSIGSSDKGKKNNRYLSKNEEGKTELKLSDAVGGIASGIGSMTSSLEQLGIDVPKGMKDVLGGFQAVTGLLTGITAIITAIEAISTADTILPFAGGGVVKAAGGYRVPGRTFSGDLVPARLNAGELVLNQAQAGVIANALQDREFGGGSGMMQPYVDGEKIFLGMNNTSKRMGRGEIVTTGTLRRLGLI